MTDSVTNRAEPREHLDQFRVTGAAFRHPLLVSMEQIEDGQVLVADELLSCYGVGDSPEEAVEDLAVMLMEHQADLAEAPDKLSAHLRRQLRMLDYFLGPRC